MNSHPSCLIIGGAGYVGSAIAAAADRRGWRVTSVGRETYPDYVGSRFDVVINANGNASRFKANQEPLFDFEASAATVYRSLFDIECERYALISSVDVYNDTARLEATTEQTPIDAAALCPYGFHKRLAELFVMRQSVQWQIFRLAQMVGPGLKKGPIWDLLQGRPLWIHDETRLHYMNTRRVGEVVLALIERGPVGEIYNVCGRGNVEFRRVMELVPPELRSPARADTERQVYLVSTEKTNRLCPLPDSWEEVRAFVAEAIAQGAIGQ